MTDTCTRMSDGQPRISVLLLGDSLSMPRVVADQQVSLSDTYPMLLSCDSELSAFEFACRGARARTMPDALKELDNEKSSYAPKIVVVHTGIVDCSPRVFTRFQRRVLSKVGPFRVPIVQFAHKHRRTIIRAFPNRVYTTRRTFQNAAESICNIALTIDALVVFVGIAPCHDATEFRSPGLLKNIRMYNGILQSLSNPSGCAFIDAFE